MLLIRSLPTGITLFVFRQVLISLFDESLAQVGRFVTWSIFLVITILKLYEKKLPYCLLYRNF